ncbi:hypothetical protein CRG98_049490, partial [Punica granatum]
VQKNVYCFYFSGDVAFDSKLWQFIVLWFGASETVVFGADFAGGLSMNDFIVAAKIDLIKTSDLVPKKRIWA